MSDEKLLTVEEVAERVGKTPDWGRDQTNAGVIPVIVINPRVWFYHWPTVLAYLEKHYGRNYRAFSASSGRMHPRQQSTIGASANRVLSCDSNEASRLIVGLW
jgi:hypothetical protein